MSSQQSYKEDLGTDYNGSDMDVQYWIGKDACQNSCDQRSDCVGYTIGPNACFLKSALNNRTPNMGIRDTYIKNTNIIAVPVVTPIPVNDPAPIPIPVTSEMPRIVPLSSPTPLPLNSPSLASPVSTPTLFSETIIPTQSRHHDPSKFANSTNKSRADDLMPSQMSRNIVNSTNTSKSDGLMPSQMSRNISANQTTKEDAVSSYSNDKPASANSNTTLFALLGISIGAAILIILAYFFILGRTQRKLQDKDLNTDIESSQNQNYHTETTVQNMATKSEYSCYFTENTKFDNSSYLGSADSRMELIINESFLKSNARDSQEIISIFDTTNASSNQNIFAHLPTISGGSAGFYSSNPSYNTTKEEYVDSSFVCQAGQIYQSGLSYQTSDISLSTNDSIYRKGLKDKDSKNYF